MTNSDSLVGYHINDIIWVCWCGHNKDCIFWPVLGTQHLKDNFWAIFGRHNVTGIFWSFWSRHNVKSYFGTFIPTPKNFNLFFLAKLGLSTALVKYIYLKTLHHNIPVVRIYFFTLSQKGYQSSMCKGGGRIHPKSIVLADN